MNTTMLEEKTSEKFVYPDHGIYDGIDENVYHADPRSLSSTGAKTILAEGLDVFHYEQTHEAKRSEAFDLGSVAHALILGVGEYEVVDAPNWVTKAAKQARAEAREAGKTPILTAQFEQALAMREAVLAHPIASEIFSEGKPEQSIYGIDPSSGATLRGRLDWMREDSTIDLKTTSQGASPEEFGKALWNYRYDIQAAHYRHIEKLNGRDVPFYWVVVSTKAPHQVFVYEAPNELVARAGLDLEGVYEDYARAIVEDEWPSKWDPQHVYSPILPKWAYQG